MVCLPILKMGRSLLLNGQGMLATGWSCVCCVFLLLPSCSSSCYNLPRWQVLGKILIFTCSAETHFNFSICTPNDVSAQSMLQYRDVPDLPSDGSALPGLRTQGLSPPCPWIPLSPGSRDVAAWTELKGKRKEIRRGSWMGWWDVKDGKGGKIRENWKCIAKWLGTGYWEWLSNEMRAGKGGE